MKFAHIADCHLGGWRQPALQKLNTQSFKKAIAIAIEEKVSFVLVAGDLFDSAFPPIDILKDTFAQFRKLKEAGIKSYVIAGSHDYSVSGKTFLDVLEHAGFCTLCKYTQHQDTQEIILEPTTHESYYIYGFPGRRSGLEVPLLRTTTIKEPYKDHFRILMLHTTVKECSKDLPVDSISLQELPKADYYALGHIHTDFEYEHDGKPAVYGGPTFPNNFKELAELKGGRMYIIEVGGFTKVTKKDIRLKEVEYVNIGLDNAIEGTEKIIEELEKRELTDKIVLLRVEGQLTVGKPSDIKYQEIEEYCENKNCYVFLKSTSKLDIKKTQQIQLESREMEVVENTLLKKYEKENPSQFNHFIFPLMESLQMEKQEGETKQVFENRLIADVTKMLSIELD